MNRSAIFLLLVANSLFGQQPPYDVFPEAKPPYHRVRYEASEEPGKLIFLFCEPNYVAQTAV